ncbi:MAG TPA: Asp-tRNA(Asn)/Glu-tRNA(Gln) amidotransferase subunit GatA [Chitinophagales bacterium]|nr:Asp-tRNA(Asn)/Glu-tRNA(Gln) amidotransferase subunit GatA [Chitinophagales bacterium]HRK26811.1 Asp-tRNA(Asn)/Glu-tRNA(Gln) amidotransferase subunit GatA [Chitinophagales bacterium]
MRYTQYRHFSAQLQNGETSCVAAVTHYLQAIANSQNLNAFLEVFADESLHRAAQLDAERASGKPTGKLHGMVVAIKDVLCYKGHRVTAASRILEGFTSLYSATAIERILAEGAIIIGRLNCDEFAMGSTNENSAYGNVCNAADTTKVPGGSSGGSAVAVQAGLCMAALGSDTGGSVRQPASFCNVVGVKPTYGRISRHGLIAYASSFDQIGTLTTNIPDAALLLEVMAGHDDFDATASAMPVQPYSQLLQLPDEPLQLAYFEETIAHPGLDPEIKQQTQQLLHSLSAQGHTVTPLRFPYLDYVVPTYYILTTAEASANLQRYDGIRYGYRSPDAHNLEEVYTLSRTQGFGKEVKRRIMLGTFVLSSGYYNAYYAKAQRVRRLLKNAVNDVFAQRHLLLMPTTPTTAFNLGDKAYQNPITMYLSDIYTVLANLAGVPAVSLPLFTHSNGLPFGVQLMSPYFKEANLLATSQWLMQHHTAH